MKVVEKIKWVNNCGDNEIPYTTCYEGVFWQYVEESTIIDKQIINYNLVVNKNKCCNCLTKCVNKQCKCVDPNLKGRIINELQSIGMADGFLKSWIKDQIPLHSFV